VSSVFAALTVPLVEREAPRPTAAREWSGHQLAIPQRRERQLYSLSVREKIGNFAEELGMKHSSVE